MTQRFTWQEYHQTLAFDGYIYVLAITLSQASLLLLYRIFHDKSFRIAAWVIVPILGIWATITRFVAVFACRLILAS